jgi:hypothetical protein
MRAVWITVFAVASMVSIWPQTPAGSAEAPDLLIADPAHYHLEIENQWVRVIRERLGPHEKAVLHHHPDPGGVVIFLTDQNLRQTSADGTTQMGRHKAGDVIWSPGRTHQGENLSDAVFEYIEVEPKQSVGGAAPAHSAPGADAADPLVADSRHFTLVLENEWVRVIHERLAGHEIALMHRHPDPGNVTVFLTNATVQETLADGEMHMLLREPGAVAFSPGRTHGSVNMNYTPLDCIEVELKLR